MIWRSWDHRRGYAAHQEILHPIWPERRGTVAACVCAPRLVTVLIDAVGTSWVGLHNLRAKLVRVRNHTGDAYHDPVQRGGQQAGPVPGLLL
jgi:hypothetical protein